MGSTIRTDLGHEGNPSGEFPLHFQREVPHGPERVGRVVLHIFLHILSTVVPIRMHIPQKHE